MINAIAWIIAITAWVVILLSPAALVMLVTVGPWRRWWLRPLTRRLHARRRRAWLARQAAIVARTAELEAECEAADLPVLDGQIQRRIIR